MPHSRRNYNSEPSRTQSRHHSGDRDYLRSSSSRGFDCCSRSSNQSRPAETYSSRSRTAPSKTNTYGTYIWPLDESQRYVSTDPTQCRCNCCPHPITISHNREESGQRHYPDPQPRQPHYPQPQPSRRNSSYESTRDRAANPHSFRPIQDRRTPYDDRRTSYDDRFVIDVVDNTDSPLARQYGRSYPITLSKTASIKSVVSFLAPDKRRARIVVHWKDGEVEPLDEQVPVAELRKYGKYIEIKEKKKVRFA